jgi:thiol reductant ABC exporter CydC subunit
MPTRGVVRHALELEQLALRRAVIAGLLVTLSTIGLAGTSAWLIVRSAQEPAVLSLTVPMGLVQLFALSKAAGRYVERTQTHRSALGVMGHVRASVARLLEPLVPAGLGPNSADVVDVVVRDVDRVQDLLTAVAGPLLTSMFAGLVAVAVAGVIVPWTALTLFAGLLATAVVLPLLAARVGESSANEMDLVRSEMVSLFDRAAQGGDEYVMAGASVSLERELATLEDRFDKALHGRTAMMGVISGLTTLISGLCVIAVVALTAVALRQGQVGPALVAVPALLGVSALELVGGVAPSLVGFRGDRVALVRLEALANVEAPVKEPAEPGAMDSAADELVATGLTRTFDGHQVLSNISFDLARGDVVMLGGPSGGGKTTFARLLAKFLDPDDGSLRIGSSPYEDLLSRQVRERVGFVDDAPHVFATSLAGNLRIAKPTATVEELEAALEAAGLSQLLVTMPEGLDTRLGGSATGLSGGEQRRLGVARELLVRRPIVIFDEPTEGLDEETATKVMSSIVERYRDGAVLVISHWGTDQVNATRRVDLRDGSLAELDATPAR